MEKKEIQLSILIPSIPSRFEKVQKLIAKLQSQTEDKNIEIISIIDNKVKSIGEKRDDLVQICNGKYFMFVDDDDDIENLDDVYERTFLDVDVITSKSECRNPNGSIFIVTHRIENEIEHNNDGEGNYLDCNRPPFHVNAWNKKYKKYRFPHVSYGEDWGWLKKFIHLAKEESYIDKIVYKYNFDPLVTEASTESNSEWTNPNIVIKDNDNDNNDINNDNNNGGE
jgi:hypothetical protein